VSAATEHRQQDAPATGTERMTYREALRLALREELTRDERVFIMGEEVGVFEGSYKVTAGLMAEFGADRVRDTPISEEGFVGAGVGAAMLGERPVVEIMTLNFLLVAMDQVINHAAKIGAMFGGEVRCPLVIRTPNGAGNQLTAQHSQSFDGWFAGTPGLKVVSPANPADAKGLLKAAIRDEDPVLVIENLRSTRRRATSRSTPSSSRRSAAPRWRGRAPTSRSCRTRSRRCARSTSPRSSPRRRA
jgi:pyruvate dehydrogenase E1 component beta subunit